ncbi:MAG: hypothetical protein KDA69_00815 [Planctomycetaceae bacterium]|nr:hypothetical protein [Planctomycetaceae bacterium]
MPRTFKLCCILLTLLLASRMANGEEQRQELSVEVRQLLDALWPIRERLVSGECEIEEVIYESFDTPPVPESKSQIVFDSNSAAFRMEYSSFNDPDLSFKFVENQDEIARYSDEMKSMQIRSASQVTRKRRPLKLIDPRNLGIASWSEMDRRLLSDNRDAFLSYIDNCQSIRVEAAADNPAIRVLKFQGKKRTALRKIFLDPAKDFASVRLEIWYPRREGEGYEETPQEVDEITWTLDGNSWVPTKAIFTQRDDRSVRRELDIVWKNVNGEIPHDEFASESLPLPPEATVYDGRTNPDHPMLVRGGSEHPAKSDGNSSRGSMSFVLLVILNLIIFVAIGAVMFIKRRSSNTT